MSSGEGRPWLGRRVELWGALGGRGWAVGGGRAREEAGAGWRRLGMARARAPRLGLGLVWGKLGHGQGSRCRRAESGVHVQAGRRRGLVL